MSSARAPTILLFGTLDTKLSEFLHVRKTILEHCNARVIFADVGREPSESDLIDITQSAVLEKHPVRLSQTELVELARDKSLDYLAVGMTSIAKRLIDEGAIHGAISLGGSCGTSLAAKVMREALPIGFPKLVVSTVASGDVSSYIGELDITMMYSVVDVAGLNSILAPIFENAAAAISGMARAYWERQKVQKNSKSNCRCIALSMFGVTTPAVQAAQRYIASLGADKYETFVFHATGAGGKAMERLISEGRVDGVLDLTTTELADQLVGGVMPGGPDRLTAAAKQGIPQIISVGALDMVNFGPPNTVPEKFEGRKFYEHNPSVTLMRTNIDENRQIGQQIAQKLREHSKSPELVQVWLPTSGISLLSGKDGTFYDLSADDALFAAVKEGLAGSEIKVVEFPKHINDEEFAVAATKKLLELMKISGSS